MKLFENELANFQDYIKQAIIQKNVELECIFGSSHFKNPITKKIFLSLLNKCKENYSFLFK